ncbi:unnamed protein product, partial [Ectocarpus sp. 13 AM-2016]
CAVAVDASSAGRLLLLLSNGAAGVRGPWLRTPSEAVAVVVLPRGTNPPTAAALPPPPEDDVPTARAAQPGCSPPPPTFKPTSCRSKAAVPAGSAAVVERLGPASGWSPLA